MLYAKWGNRVVTGEEKAVKPEIIAFRNSLKAIEIFNKRIIEGAKIAIHCDVDVDGIGSGYIADRFIKTRIQSPILYIINKDKVHGVSQKHVDILNSRNLDLLIIVDSSSNDIDIIKQFNCDVVVIDHHEVGHSDLAGVTNDKKHEYVIVNNTIDNCDISEINEFIYKKTGSSDLKVKEYRADDRMSCGLVIYELLRLYCYTLGVNHLLENLRLFQWVGVTLFTDAILLNTPRNQWYIENTVHSNEIEVTLGKLLSELNPFKVVLDKSVINYTIAPMINRAIRAGCSSIALSIVMNNPSEIKSLDIYRENQDNALAIGINNIIERDSYISRDLTNTDIHKNYNGVIASRISGDFNKNAIVYRVTDGIAEGSFRGRIPSVEYRKYIDNFSNDTWAQGHKAAFGFRIPVDELDAIMRSLISLEDGSSKKRYLTAGRLNDIDPGQFIINDMDEFKRQGGIWRLGIGNSKLSNDEQIMIEVSSADAVLESQIGKLYIYKILGLECKAFKPIDTDTVNIYVEYSRQIDIYIK